jgi:hypothetical protein
LRQREEYERKREEERRQREREEEEAYQRDPYKCRKWKSVSGTVSSSWGMSPASFEVESPLRLEFVDAQGKHNATKASYLRVTSQFTSKVAYWNLSGEGGRLILPKEVKEEFVPIYRTKKNPIISTTVTVRYCDTASR